MRAPGWDETRRAARPRTRSRCRRSSATPRRHPTAVSDSQILAGGDALDLTAAALLVVLGDDRADVDDALALLAGDLRPVVGVRRVRQVLVLAELLLDRVEQVLRADARTASRDGALDRQLLGAPHDVLDHGARREVL